MAIPRSHRYLKDANRSMNDETNERRKIRLTEAQLDYIIKGVKKQALDEIYAEIGKGVVKRMLWLFGAGGSGLAAYLAYKGYK